MKKVTVLLILAIILLICGIFFGSRLLGTDEIFSSPIAELRFIRMCAAFVIGGSLALSGAVLQSLLKNVLAEPFTLGISGGAGIGAALAFVTGLRALTLYAVPFAALCGALLVLTAVLFISRRGNYGTESLLLSGVIAGTICSSVLMYILSVAQVDELANVTWWMLGDLQSVDSDLLIFQAGYAVFAVLLVQFFAKDINILSLGDEHAFYMGVNVRKVNFILITAMSFLAAGTVALAGIISFCGLIVPHIVRRIFGSDQRKTVFCTFLAGGIFLMLCDIASRIIFIEREIPIGVLTSLIGGPLFLFILNRRKKNAAKC